MLLEGKGKSGHTPTLAIRSGWLILVCMCISRSPSTCSRVTSGPGHRRISKPPIVGVIAGALSTAARSSDVGCRTTDNV